MYVIYRNNEQCYKEYIAYNAKAKKKKYKWVKRAKNALKFEDIFNAQQYTRNNWIKNVCIEPFIAPKMATIYSLAHPITRDIFYVGSTKLKLKSRVYKKYRCKTAQEIYSLGLTPIAEPIECCAQDEKRESEIFWIHQMKAWGFNLENKHYNNKFFLSSMRTGENNEQ